MHLEDEQRDIQSNMQLESIYYNTKNIWEDYGNKFSKILIFAFLMAISCARVLPPAFSWACI